MIRQIVDFSRENRGPGPILFGSSPSPSPSPLINLHDTTALDVAYWSIKEDREMWPMVEA